MADLEASIQALQIGVDAGEARWTTLESRLAELVRPHQRQLQAFMDDHAGKLDGSAERIAALEKSLLGLQEGHGAFERSHYFQLVGMLHHLSSTTRTQPLYVQFDHFAIAQFLSRLAVMCSAAVQKAALVHSHMLTQTCACYHHQRS